MSDVTDRLKAIEETLAEMERRTLPDDQYPAGLRDARLKTAMQRAARRTISGHVADDYGAAAAGDAVVTAAYIAADAVVLSSAQAYVDALTKLPITVYTASNAVAVNTASVFDLAVDGTATLAASPANGSFVFLHAKLGAGIKLTIARNGKNIDGVASDVVLDQAAPGEGAGPAGNQYVGLRYESVGGSWWRF